MIVWIAAATFEASLFLSIFKKIGIQVLAVFTGFVFGWLMITLVPFHIPWLSWIVAIMFVIGSCLLAHYKKTETKIFQGGLIGSYYIGRGVSLWIGGFQNELEIYQKIMAGEGFNKWFYCYLLCMAIATALSAFI